MAILLGLGNDTVDGWVTINAGQIGRSVGGYTSTGAGTATSINIDIDPFDVPTGIWLGVYNSAGTTLLAEVEITSPASGVNSGTISLAIVDATNYLLCFNADNFTAVNADTSASKTYRGDTQAYGSFPSSIPDSQTSNTTNQELAIWLEGTEGGGILVPKFMNNYRQRRA